MKYKITLLSFVGMSVWAQTLTPVRVRPTEYFPLRASEVAELLSNNHSKQKLREHGWRLLDLVFEDADKREGKYRPVWYTWCTQTEVIEMPALPCTAGAPRLERTALQRRKSNAPSTRSAKIPLEVATIISDVYISPELVDYLNEDIPGIGPLRKVKDALPDWLGKGNNKIPERFQRNEMVVKVAWQHVPCPRDSPSTLKVWTGNKKLVNGLLTMDSENFQSVPVGFREVKGGYTPRCNPPSSQYSNPPGARNINNYFWFQIREGDLPKVTGNPTTMATGKVEVGDYFVASGIHIITREAEEWVWATYWLTSKEDDDQRSILKGNSTGTTKARQFAMNISLVADDTIANPFLEGRHIPDGINSNCLSCHRQAAMYPIPGKRPYCLNQPASINLPAPGDNALKTSLLWMLPRQALSGCKDP